MEFDFDLENPLSAGDEQSCQIWKVNEPMMLFEAESDHMSSFSIVDLGQLSARCLALSVIVQAQFCNNLDPALAYLAINYVDRFLARREIPLEKPWIARLLAISCLSLASKMKSIGFSPADLQMVEGFIFDAQTIRRMELVVLGALEWRMRSITPFSFLRFFLSFFPLETPVLIHALKAHASQILFKSQNEIKSFEFRPSMIAASALLAAARELSPAHFLPYRAALLSSEHLNKESLAECCALMDSYDSIIETEPASNDCDSGFSALTPVTVLGHHQDGLESEKTVGSTSDGHDARKRRNPAARPI